MEMARRENFSCLTNCSKPNAAAIELLSSTYTMKKYRFLAIEARSTNKKNNYKILRLSAPCLLPGISVSFYQFDKFMLYNAYILYTLYSFAINKFINISKSIC